MMVERERKRKTTRSEAGWSKQQSSRSKVKYLHDVYTMYHGKLVKSVMQEKEVKEGEMYHHCSHPLSLLSLALQTLPVYHGT